MANPEHLEILKQGVEVWNKWREQNANIIVDLKNVSLSYEILAGINFTRANLSGAEFVSADMSGANFNRANLVVTNLRKAKLVNANFTAARINGAFLIYADLREADFNSARLHLARLQGANLHGADLSFAHIDESYLEDADFSGVLLQSTTFSGVDLSAVKGLDRIRHKGPSSIGIDTLYMSAGKVPEAFLRGCGVPEDFITFIPSHFGIQQAIQFYSCFISYSSKDEKFARRLYSRMRDEKLRVWFAPEDIKGGQKLHEQIERAIQVHDRLLIVLSEESMRSEWVITEIKRARRTEIREKRRKLFPIRLVDFETIQAWECFDADTGMDLAAEVRSYFIPDFSNWKDHDAFEKAFDRLLRDLRAEEGK